MGDIEQIKRLLRERHIAPSILSADFGRLREQVAEVLSAGARLIHVDVMDGHFVPPITMGPIAVQALSEQVRAAGALLDVHLMVERPERHVEPFAQAGAHSLTFHCEATPQLAYAIDAAHQAGLCAGVALNPGTPVAAIEAVAALADMLLCMTVNPGWGGQCFIASSPEKVKRLRDLAGERIALEVDGGIDVSTAPLCLDAGANLFVAGAAIFAQSDPAAAYASLAAAIA